MDTNDRFRRADLFLAASRAEERDVRRAHGGRTGSVCAAILAAVVVCGLARPGPLHAQGVSTGPPVAASPAPRDDAPRRRANRLYLGMWTTHLKEDVLVLDNNWLVGVSARGLFGATFLNSFGRRGFAGGLQRTIVASDPRPIGASLGIRLGAITGYDGRLIRIARETPVLPLIQPFATVDVRRFGVEVSYTFVVVSVAVSYGF